MHPFDINLEASQLLRNSASYRQPADAQIQESRKASFSVAATSQTIGSPDIPAIYYQWQKQAPGASSFTDIAGATSSGYATGKLTAADNNTQFRCVVSVIGFSTNSVAAKLTIVPDTFPPQITGVGSLQKTSGAIEIGIGFDEELDPVSAGTASNYKLSSGMVTGVRFEKYVTEVGAVVLATSGLTPGANTTVTVTGVKDLKGNTMAATQKPVSITSRLKWAAVGGDDYIQAGGSAAIWPDDAVAISDRDFDLVSSGSANWDNYDEITFAYESVTGDFDKVVRVEYQDPTSQWARAGLMARAALDEGVDRATGGTGEPEREARLAAPVPHHQSL